MKGQSEKQFAIYSRKSKFTGKGESIENQIELCRSYIASCYSTKAAQNALIYEDEGFSGGTLDRPQFKKMMADSHNIALDAIVVYRLDRISRNIGDFAKLIEDLGNRNIGFISIREQFDTASPMGRAMMYIASVFSQLERETIAERIRDNMQELSKTGRWLGGNTPFGYHSETCSQLTPEGKTRKAARLVAVPEEVAVVQQIFQQFLRTNSLTQVEQYLQERQYITRNNKPFTRFSIKAILTNPVYMIGDDEAYRYLTRAAVNLFSPPEAFDGYHGIMTYNRTIQHPGKAHQFQPMEEWIVAVGNHPGIVPGADWVHTQNLLQQNRSKGHRKTRSSTALLGGLLYCGRCGSPMRPKLTNRVGPNGIPVYTYLCITKERSHGGMCSTANLNGNHLDDQVMDMVKKIPEYCEQTATLLEGIRQNILRTAAQNSGEKLRIERLAESNEREIETLIVSLGRMERTVAEPYILRRIEKLRQKEEELRKQLDTWEATQNQHSLSQAEIYALGSTLASLDQLANQMSVQEKRNMLHQIIEKAVWDGETVHLYLTGAPLQTIPPSQKAKTKPLCEDSK